MVTYPRGTIAPVRRELPTLLDPALLHPRYWFTWIGVLFMWLITRLPYSWQIGIGAGLGRLGYHLARSRRNIVEVNISLAFQELGEFEQRSLVRQTFRSSGISLVETAMAWFCDPRQLQEQVTIKGLEHLEAAHAEGKGVILLGMHFGSLDLCGAVLGTYMGFCVMYRRNKNQLMERVMARGRIKNFPDAIQRDDVRRVVRALKAGQIVWYGPDQDYGRKNAVFVPFMGISTATITGTSRLARISGSRVVPFALARREDQRGYEISLLPAFENFPGESDEKDCLRINQIIESQVRRFPDQYWWLHRRFKTRPEGEPRPY